VFFGEQELDQLIEALQRARGLLASAR
jgi:hypothetical protein